MAEHKVLEMTAIHIHHLFNQLSSEVTPCWPTSPKRDPKVFLQVKIPFLSLQSVKAMKEPNYPRHWLKKQNHPLDPF